MVIDKGTLLQVGNTGTPLLRYTLTNECRYVEKVETHSTIE